MNANYLHNLTESAIAEKEKAITEEVKAIVDKIVSDCEPIAKIGNFKTTIIMTRRRTQIYTLIIDELKHRGFDVAESKNPRYDYALDIKW